LEGLSVEVCSCLSPLQRTDSKTSSFGKRVAMVVSCLR
jgi:hypothetical protein